jgi:son of sevenless-like protein
MAAIITALSATVLTQLHMTWAHVSRKSTLEGLLRYNEPTGGFSGYRTLLQQVEGSCVPFITMYLTDIIHASQHSRDENDIIFFFQRARWHEVIAQMLKFQSRPYMIAPSETTTQFIEAHLREVLCDDNWFWQRSRELQQVEAAHADIRKGLEAAGF